MQVREAIARMGTYNPPLEGRDPEQHLLMDFNESPLPPPTSVLEAIQGYLSQQRLHLYPSYGNFLENLAEYAQVSPESLILTNGSDQGIELVMRCLLEPGDQVLMARPGFAMFAQVAGTLGAHLCGPEFPPQDFRYPLEQVKASVSPQTRMIVVINPNNPTGTVVPLEQIADLLQNFPNHAIVVDEAYFEFNGLSAVPLLREFPNLILLRTFSKAFALPGLRLGYVIARPDFIEHLYKIRGPYDVNSLSVVAGSAVLEALPEIQGRVQHLMQVAKPALEAFFQEERVRHFPGGANFLLVQPPDVAAALAYLKDHGILVRPMRPPIEQTFRMNLRMLPDVEHFMEVFRGYLRSVPRKAA
jgi:histidinol-phosphate aminotransferase